MIELKNDAHALAFASAADTWLTGLKDRGLIDNWRLFRRKLGLGSEKHTDFILEIEVDSLTQLDTTFAHLMEDNDLDPRAYELLHDMIRDAKVGMYRPYPDAKQRERVALI